MDDRDFMCLETGTVKEVTEVLKRFIEKHNQTFTFNELNEDEKRSKLWGLLLKRLESQDDAPCYKYCLTSIRILSRDKTELNELVSGKRLELLLRLAGLVSQEEALTRINQPDVDYEVMLEALKCLCNIIYNSTTAQVLCSVNHSVEGIVMRLRTYRDPELPGDIKYFDMKMLFLITALCAEVRPRLKEEFHGLTYLIETLDLILKDASGEEHSDERGAACSDMPILLSDDRVGLACEVLKVLFNLTVKSADNSASDEEEEAHFLRLVSILHDLLLCEAYSKDKQYELQNHTVNLLMCVPSSCFEELMTPIQKDSREIPKEMEMEGRNMEAIAMLLDFLEHRLDNIPKVVRAVCEVVCPILTVLVEGVRNHRPMRKFLRARVLPPLTDVMTRPEEGNTIRNKLCRLLTSSDTQIRDLVSDFLFILCKENVTRMIKYTGYGNSAGLFANRGLLLGRSSSGSRSGSGSGLCQYSSDSEDSDTEEYKQYRDRINPVTGCFDPPKPNPLAGMSEEQKEYEAVKLVNMMDKLSRDGILQPCRVGEDGRPEPVEHVMQLVEDLPRQQVTSNPDDSD